MLPSHQQYHGLLLGQLHLAALPPLQCLAWPECTYPLNRQCGDAQHGCSSHPQHHIREAKQIIYLPSSVSGTHLSHHTS